MDESAQEKRPQIKPVYFLGALLVDAESALKIVHGIEKVAGYIREEEHEFSLATEFHAYPMFHGKEEWATVPMGLRVKACKLVARIIGNSGAAFIVRGTDRERLQVKYRQNAFPIHLLTMAHLLENIDSHVEETYPEEQVLVLADDHHTAAESRTRLSAFQYQSVPGYTTRKLTHIVDTIYFGPSDKSRLLQAADFATFFFNRSHTIPESDERSKKAMDKIMSDLRRICKRDYIWP